jgi:hypothetical protein
MAGDIIDTIFSNAKNTCNKNCDVSKITPQELGKITQCARALRPFFVATQILQADGATVFDLIRVLAWLLFLDSRGDFNSSPLLFKGPLRHSRNGCCVPRDAQPDYHRTSQPHRQRTHRGLELSEPVYRSDHAPKPPILLPQRRDVVLFVAFFFPSLARQRASADVRDRIGKMIRWIGSRMSEAFGYEDCLAEWRRFKLEPPIFTGNPQHPITIEQFCEFWTAQEDMYPAG